MKLIFLRHGQTNYNLKDLCNGRPNPKVRLTTLGRKQATAAALKLKREPIEAIFISQLYRSRQTATIINKYHHVPVFMDKRINDRQMGRFEGKPAGLFYRWRDKQKNRWTCVIPDGGESYEHMKKRVASFLTNLNRKNKYKTVLIVTHEPIIKVARGFFKHLSNRQMDAPALDNGTIMRFIIKRKKS